jgi:SH3 domain-containing YSC84-like protein 1
MKTSLLRYAALTAVFALATSGLQAAKKTYREQLAEKLASCEYSFDVVMSKPDSSVPPKALREAKGIVIIHQYRVGLIFGGQGGSAVMMARNPQNGTWGPPVFLDPGGVNFGLQAGAKEINMIFLLMSDEAVRMAYTGRWETGADATAVAGPRSAEVENYDLFKAPVLIYSSFGGLFAGASVKTGWLRPNDRANRELYQTKSSTPEIVMSPWFADKIPAEVRGIYNRVGAVGRAK